VLSGLRQLQSCVCINYAEMFQLQPHQPDAPDPPEAEATELEEILKKA